MSSLQFPGLAEKVAFLSRPASYPHMPEAVTVTETHMSWVFLAGERVYKMKKPVSYPFLDFSTLEARRRNCEEEVRLNARLAAGIYLGAIPLHATGTGEFSFKPIGEAVEWLVCMKRLPASRMLDEMIIGGTLRPADLKSAVAKLMAFYVASPRLDVSPDVMADRFMAEHAEDAHLLSDPRFALDHGKTRRTLDSMKTALAMARPWLEQRAAAKVYVEAHGDLRPEHVCLTPEPAFIDCFEFNRGLRVLDPFDEVAYLALECQRLGAPWVGDVFLSAAHDNLSPPAPPALIGFYQAARALLRARLALAHLLDPSPRTPQKWEPRARQYISIAENALTALRNFSAHAH